MWTLLTMKMISETSLAFFSLCRVLPSYWEQQSYSREQSLFTLAKSTGPVPLLYSFPLGCIRSCMVNDFFWMLKIAVPHLLCCGDWYKITPLTGVFLSVFMGFWRLQESAQLEQCLGSRSHIEMKVIYALSYSKCTVTVKLETGRKHNIAYIPLLLLLSSQCQQSRMQICAFI